MKKVKLIFCVLKPGESSEDKRDEQFQASRAWLQNFMRKKHLSVRRKTSVAQKDPEKLVSKLVMYVLQVRRLQEKNQYSANNIIAMDETTRLCKNYEKIVKIAIVPPIHKQCKTLFRDDMVRLNIISLYICKDLRLKTLNLRSNESRDHYHEDGYLVPSPRYCFPFEAVSRL